MQGMQKVPHTSTTTILPFWDLTASRSWLYLTVSILTAASLGFAETLTTGFAGVAVSLSSQQLSAGVAFATGLAVVGVAAGGLGSSFTDAGGSFSRAQPGNAELYSLRALEDEQQLDFTAAEADCKQYVEKSSDKRSAELALADFYHQRLRPADEIKTLSPARGGNGRLAPSGTDAKPDELGNLDTSRRRG